MKKLLILIFPILLISTPVFSDSLCDKACKKFVTCAETVTKKKSTEQEEKAALKGCMNTCKKHYKEVKTCYNQDLKVNSCKDFAQCVADALK